MEIDKEKIIFNIGDLLYTDIEVIGIITKVYKNYIISKWNNKDLIKDSKEYVLRRIEKKIWKHFPIKKNI